MRQHPIGFVHRVDIQGYSPAGVWEISLDAAPERPALTGSDQPGDLSPLGQMVVSAWMGLAHEFPGVTLGEIVVRRYGISGLLFVPWGSVLGALIAQFKTVAAATAAKAGLLLEPMMWQHGFRGRLIEDPLELVLPRHLLRESIR